MIETTPPPAEPQPEEFFIANSPWCNPPTHVLTTDSQGRLQIAPLNEDGTVGQAFERKDTTPEEKQHLKQLVISALQQLIEDPSCQSHWERFRFTYESRGKFQWLGEFGYDGEMKLASDKKSQPISNPQKGLISAIKSVFHFYGQELNQKLIERNLTRVMSTPVDNNFKENLLQASDVITREPIEPRDFIENLARSISYQQVDIATISLDELKQNIKQAILKYWEQTHGYGYGDPLP